MKLLTQTLVAAVLASAAILPASAQTDSSSVSFKVPGVAQSNESETAPITERPAGTSTMYTRDAFTYFIMMGMAFSSNDYASAVEVIDAEDGFVYIGNPFASIQTGTWLKGKRE